MTDHCLCDYAGCIHEAPVRKLLAIFKRYDENFHAGYDALAHEDWCELRRQIAALTEPPTPATRSDEIPLEQIENHTERKWEEWTRRGEGR